MILFFFKEMSKKPRHRRVKRTEKLVQSWPETAAARARSPMTMPRAVAASTEEEYLREPASRMHRSISCMTRQKGRPVYCGGARKEPAAAALWSVLAVYTKR